MLPEVLAAHTLRHPRFFYSVSVGREVLLVPREPQKDLDKNQREVRTRAV